MTPAQAARYEALSLQLRDESLDSRIKAEGEKGRARFAGKRPEKKCDECGQAHWSPGLQPTCYQCRQKYRDRTRDYAEEQRREKIRNRVLAILRGRRLPIDADDVVQACGVERDLANSWLSRMHRTGHLERVAPGRYAIGHRAILKVEQRTNP